MKPQRNVWCSLYDQCLSKACRKNKQWTCKGCSLEFDQAGKLAFLAQLARDLTPVKVMPESWWQGRPPSQWEILIRPTPFSSWVLMNHPMFSKYQQRVKALTPKRPPVKHYKAS